MAKIGKLTFPLTANTAKFDEGLRRTKEALERLALAKKPLTADEVAGIVKSRERIPFPVLLRTLVRLAESHERLRMELDGAEKMIEASAEKLNG